MHKKVLIHLFLFVGLLWLLVSTVACATSNGVSEVPIAINFSSQAQHKVQSLAHLNNIAVDMADSVLKKYGSGGGCIPGENCNLSIFVNTPVVETEFSTAFNSQFVSALVNRGMKVVAQMPALVQVNIDMQVVTFSGSAPIASYDTKKVGCRKGIWVIRDLTDTAVHEFGSLTTSEWETGETNKSKWFYSPQKAPTTEMLITVSFIKGGQYMARTSNVYYVASDILPDIKDSGNKDSDKVAKSYKMHLVGDCPGNRCVQ